MPALEFVVDPDDELELEPDVDPELELLAELEPEPEAEPALVPDPELVPELVPELDPESELELLEPVGMEAVGELLRAKDVRFVPHPVNAMKAVVTTNGNV